MAPGHGTTVPESPGAHSSIVLLAGAGTQQTGYNLDEEVDFGRTQMRITSADALKGDIEKVGIGPNLTRIHKATEALAKGIGRGPGQKRAVRRSKRIREVVAACTTAFNAIHEDGTRADFLPSRPAPGRDQRGENHREAGRTENFFSSLFPLRLPASL